MGVSWTREQLQVIRHRDQNLLVSAAAGSGKTAVLVERILSRILDPQDPVNIDELLIVTFTKAAAGEMRERIGAALNRALEENPDNEHLQRQQTLLHHAKINTIHSFCSYVIRNYFTMIGLDPSFRQGDDREMKLLSQDVAAGVLEAAYEKAEPDFLHFIECYASGKEDTNLEELILQLSEVAASNPWPELFYEKVMALYEMTEEDFFQSEIWQELQAETVRLLADVKHEILDLLYMIDLPDGPSFYRAAIENDLLQIEEMIGTGDFETLRNRLRNQKWKMIGRANKNNSASEFLTKQVRDRRDKYKLQVKTLTEDYYAKSLEEILEQLRICREPLRVLTGLAREYDEGFRREKRSKNVVDFADLEHLALQILVEQDENGEIRPTPAAREIASGFREIMIDEYQDSNLIQEVLLSAVSGHGGEDHNRFMVGDIKQSIYGFRLARPELFLEKYHLYQNDEKEGTRIDLSRNFRSRSEVLWLSNYLFEQLMCEEFGGIAYDEAARLYAGADYPDNPVAGANQTEVLLVEASSEEQEMSGQENARSDRESEFYVIADRIRQLVGRMDIYDRNTDSFRKARYSDIVILLRAVSGWAEPLQQILASLDIPAYAASQTGYFDTTEIATILDYLRICDNPLQDIPMAAVLYSAIGGFTEEELVQIRTQSPYGPLYQALKAAAEHAEEKLKQKTGDFLARLESFRDRIPHTPIHLLISQVLEETGYLSFACAMPAGEQRRANLEMLIERAKAYEQSSYHGLFHFMRYMENLRKYEVDYGEVNINGENTDAVRIMSIHKSKGLEFPIVFLSGTDKAFNKMDANRKLLIHAELGIGADAVDPVLRVREKTLPARVIRKRIIRETLAEELRVLYVALTRAKEKLILTGVLKKPEASLNTCASLSSWQEQILPLQVLSGAGCYMDWILAALARSDAFLHLYEGIGYVPDRRPEKLKCPELPVRLCLVTPEQMVEEELLRQMNLANRKDQILREVEGDCAAPVFAGQMRERFDYSYPWEHLRSLPAKVSVSELKRAGSQEEEEGTPLLPAHLKQEPYIPSFIRRQTEEKKLLGAERGTAVHRLLEGLSFRDAHTISGIEAQVQRLTLEHKLQAQQAASVPLEEILALADSSVGRRIEQAQNLGRFHAEQPFVVGIPASWVVREASGIMDAALPEEETVLLQGMIDVWLEEEDGIVLIDYKTDYVTSKDREVLVNRYQKQLFYYKMALERLTGKRVKEVILYSLTLQEEITVKV